MGMLAAAGNSASPDGLLHLQLQAAAGRLAQPQALCQAREQQQQQLCQRPGSGDLGGLTAAQLAGMHRYLSPDGQVPPALQRQFSSSTPQLSAAKARPASLRFLR